MDGSGGGGRGGFVRRAAGSMRGKFILFDLYFFIKRRVSDVGCGSTGCYSEFKSSVFLSLYKFMKGVGVSAEWWDFKELVRSVILEEMKNL